MECGLIELYLSEDEEGYNTKIYARGTKSVFRAQ